MGLRGLERLRKKKWRKDVADVVNRLVAALQPDDKEPPPGCRLGDNANAFLGGFRMREEASDRGPSTRPKRAKPRSRRKERE